VDGMSQEEYADDRGGGGGGGLWELIATDGGERLSKGLLILEMEVRNRYLSR